MEEFRKFCAAIAGTAAMVFLIICCVADDHLSEWTLIKTNLAFNEEQSVFENVDTPQYYILKKEYGNGDYETGYVDLINQNCKEFHITQPNKCFFNCSVFSKKSFNVFNNGGVTKPDNFSGYIQYGDKPYTLAEFYENPPFEPGKRDPLQPGVIHWGWIFLGTVAFTLICLIPFEEFDFHLPRGPMIKKLEKEYKEFFDHLEMTFKAPQLRRIIVNDDWVIRTNGASSEANTIDLRCNRDGISYNYKTKKFILHDSSDITWSFAFLKYKSKWPSIYSAIADYVLNVVEGKTTEEDEIYVTI